MPRTVYPQYHLGLMYLETDGRDGASLLRVTQTRQPQPFECKPKLSSCPVPVPILREKVVQPCTAVRTRNDVHTHVPESAGYPDLAFITPFNTPQEGYC